MSESAEFFIDVYVNLMIGLAVGLIGLTLHLSRYGGWKDWLLVAIGIVLTGLWAWRWIFL